MTQSSQQLPLQDVLRISTDATKLACPVCQSTYQCTETPVEASVDDPWSGRGDLLIVPIRGECKHRWEICFGFHKGETECFARLSK
jgi:hypothetical protein